MKKGTYHVTRDIPERDDADTGGRIPRVARLLALAHRLERLIADGVVTDYAELARLGHVSRTRISQIMSLRNLAPDLQEAILFSRTRRGRDPVSVAALLTVAAQWDWQEQRRLWKADGCARATAACEEFRTSKSLTRVLIARPYLKCP